MSMIEKNTERLLTVQEAAAILKVHQNTIYNLLRENLLPFIRVGQQYRIIHNNLFLSVQKAYEIKDFEKSL